MNITSTAEMRRIQRHENFSDRVEQSRSSAITRSQIQRLIHWLFKSPEPKPQYEEIEPIMSIGDD